MKCQQPVKMFVFVLVVWLQEMNTSVTDSGKLQFISLTHNCSRVFFIPFVSVWSKSSDADKHFEFLPLPSLTLNVLFFVCYVSLYTFFNCAKNEIK